MFSVKGDTILDPFLGIGTTMYASMATGRNSVGYEIDINLREFILSNYAGIVDFSNKRITERLQKHLEFIEECYQKMGRFKYTNKHYLFPVMTGQETDLIINELKSVVKTDENAYEATYSDKPQEGFVGVQQEYVMSASEKNELTRSTILKQHKKDHEQQQLLK